MTEVLAHIRTQRNGLIQTPDQLRCVSSRRDEPLKPSRSFRFSYMAIAAGLRELEELEQSEEPFNEQSDGDSESDAEDEEEGKEIGS